MKLLHVKFICYRERARMRYSAWVRFVFACFWGLEYSLEAEEEFISLMKVFWLEELKSLVNVR